MLDQNITTIISTLVGGLLTIAGSIVANFYIQKNATKSQRRKDIKGSIEKIYSNVLESNSTIFYFFLKRKPEDAQITIEQLFGLINQINLIIWLYMPQLKDDGLKFQEEIFNIIIDLRKYGQGRLTDDEIEETLTKNLKYQKTFRKQIEDFAKKQGYHYF